MLTNESGPHLKKVWETLV